MLVHKEKKIPFKLVKLFVIIIIIKKTHTLQASWMFPLMFPLKIKISSVSHEINVALKNVINIRMLQWHIANKQMSILCFVLIFSKPLCNWIFFRI